MSIRRTRFEFLASRPNRERKATTRDVAVLLAKHVKRSLIAKGLIPDPATQQPKRLFGWSYGRDANVVQANTRSEARALVKKELGINKNHRLPAGVQITELVQEKLPKSNKPLRGTRADQPASA